MIFLWKAVGRKRHNTTNVPLVDRTLENQYIRYCMPMNGVVDSSMTGSVDGVGWDGMLYHNKPHHLRVQQVDPTADPTIGTV